MFFLFHRIIQDLLHVLYYLFQDQNIPVEQGLALEGDTSGNIEWVVEQVEEVGDSKHTQVQHYVDEEQIGPEVCLHEPFLKII